MVGDWEVGPIDGEIVVGDSDVGLMVGDPGATDGEPMVGEVEVGLV